MRILLGAAAAALFFISAAPAADSPPIVSTQVARTNTTLTGQPIVVPSHPDVIVTLSTFAPGARLPVHEHIFPHYLYVLSGVLSFVNAQTNKTTIAKEGDFVVEPVDTWHFGFNSGTTPLKVLVIDQVWTGAPNNTVVKPQ